uniref:H/ACA ribonucleoprotein complex subunit 2-like protein n=1 Tax=Aceria tosichella TaxID=561515 RepID=A0A6G1SBN0_9ACAR
MEPSSPPTQEGDEEQPQVANNTNAIAQPLADPKLSKRLYKLIKKSAAKKNKLCRGLRNVQTRIRKGGQGLCILAGDVTPIDIYCHLPIVCEDKNIPYCFVESKKDIAEAIGAKRPCIVALVEADDEYKDLYDKCYNKLSRISC